MTFRRKAAQPEEFLDVRATSLDEWLQLLRTPLPGKIFAANHFPTESHQEEFLRRLPTLDEEDVRLVLRHFLISTGSNLLDRFSAEHVFQEVTRGTRHLSELREHQRRLYRHFQSLGDYPVWEGVHWVLDLLPHQPRQALAVLDSFFWVSCQFMTDAYLTGFGDAKAIIRHRYIHSPGTEVDAKSTLASLEWREVEWLAGVLDKAMKYKVVVTPRSDDDGIDVLATGTGRGEPRRLVVQTKRWSKSPIEKAEVRELVGAMDAARATGGVLIATGTFRAGALKIKAKDPRIDLIDGDEFVRLLNEYCGNDWYLGVDRLISGLKQETGATAEVHSRRPGGRIRPGHKASKEWTKSLPKGRSRNGR